MPNYVGHARSNYFRVRDAGAFREWVVTLPDVRAQEEPEGSGRFVLLAETDHGGWPPARELEDGLEGGVLDEEIDLCREVSEHLVEGEVAVFQETGHRRLVALVGYAAAVNHRGETLSVDIEEIYERVKAAGWAEDVARAVN